ncbi:MAG: type II toxin-antitoxin system ParD family antitoxin [Acidobacteria bacterium]|nr:type II toxin-antitoxin system ParD family antitoxin [Acidobacteriota bacterium]MBI3426560.1 type II toxin-antitoxin system ParD family antitoxin [Acidobacteriota bacterium]
MTTLNISLPDNLKIFIDSRLAEGGYDTVSDYFHELVEQDQARKEQKRLEAVLVERLQGEDWEELSPADWVNLRQELKERLAVAERG